MAAALLPPVVARGDQPAGPAVDAQPPVVIDIARATEPIVIDGQLDEPTWRRAQVLDVSYQANHVGRRNPEIPLRVRYAWDEHYLYIAYELRDTDLRALSDGRVVGPPDNQRPAALPWTPELEVDVVEFFITFHSRRFIWEIHHNALNHRNETLNVVIDPDDPVRRSALNSLGVLLLKHEYVDDDGAYTSQSASRLLANERGELSTPNHPDDTDTGYIGEMRLPWLSLGAPRAARTGRPGSWNLEGKTLQILAVALNGNDGKPVYHHDSPTRPARGMFAEAVTHYPWYRLVREATPCTTDTTD